ncbi:MAG TPA: bifunctional methylenetetrahydrofolate dehydrogenase/methenyltetrahydrofolate cyclohydrolase FolD [Burkholderiales bacterium]|nr:bifunctional methylenetetrahydrofolate dehydrogenase/methenyltetrahydrofolate cyclohydrolase FolD [Burkholderiales bacterium]
MSAKIIDGKRIAAEMREALRQRVESLGHVGLAVIIVGDNPASKVYVRNKEKACIEAGIHSEVIALPAQTTQEEVLERVRMLNFDPKIHGILVQLPLPPHFDSRKVLDAISAQKDVDGFHPFNVGSLLLGNAGLQPCTPHGVMRMLEHEKVEIRGKHAVIVGASNIVGKPMAIMLLHAGATITICNSKTRDLAHHTRDADILVVAVGRPNIVTGEMIKDGAVVIDVGMNRLENGSLAGDVDFETASKRASMITPVPGGVGPMTIAMLLENTVEAARVRVAGKV